MLKGAWALAIAATLNVGVARAALTLKLEDYATAPMTGVTSATAPTPNSAYLARVNFMAEEPGGGNRFFVNDLNGPLYILDKTTKQFTTYLNFNGQSGQPGLFSRFTNSQGYANGLITFQFDPDYANNGKFYTIHMETPSTTGLNPITTNFPGVSTANFSPTTAVTTPLTSGSNPARRTVLLEWTDTNRANSAFEGSVRELLRLDMHGQIHPMGDLIFNPTAGPDDPDWRVMYISIGDGGAGENSNTDVRRTPQRLDTLGGKILRIIPDLAEQVAMSTLSPNGRYRIPNDNPFVSINDASVRDEIYALGLRNPHRVSWDVDPENPANNHMIIDDIGLHTWEEVNILHAGANYGYSEREGNQRLNTNNSTSALPSPDTVPVRINGTTTSGTVTPIYPVIQYGHENATQGPKGDSISSGYVYRGSRIPALNGKYIFGEITTGQIFYADYAEMLAVDDGNPGTLAAIQSIDILWDNPNDAPNVGAQAYTTTTSGSAVLGPMFQIIEKAYEARGGLDPNLPGAADVTGNFGRADIRLLVDEAGELYILSKSDGMIRALVGPEANADFDADGDVDGADFLQWQRGNGGPGGLAQGDADGNGVVNGADFTHWKQRFGQGGAAVEPAGVAAPEPTAAVLAAGGLIAAALTRRRRITRK